jgi:hypothetical protein
MQVEDFMAILNRTDWNPMHNRLARCSVIAAQCCIVYAAYHRTKQNIPTARLAKKDMRGHSSMTLLAILFGIHDVVQLAHSVVLAWPLIRTTTDTNDTT